MFSFRCSLCIFIAVCFICVIAEKNVFTFERAVCHNVTNDVVKIVKCVAKSVNRTHVRGDLRVQSNRTLKSVFVHIVGYYQFSSNEFRPFLLDVWEDVCGVLRRDEGNIISNLIYERLRNYTNVNHPCPYTPGLYYAKADNIPLDLGNFGQLFPAGRYRFEVNVTEGYKGQLLGSGYSIGSISDRRVTKF